jgi:hypothetical protein
VMGWFDPSSVDCLTRLGHAVTALGFVKRFAIEQSLGTANPGISFTRLSNAEVIDESR